MATHTLWSGRPVAYRSGIAARFASGEWEEAFRRAEAEASLRSSRVALLLALTIYAGVGALDPWIAGAAAPDVWMIRGVVCVGLVVAFAASHNPVVLSRIQPLLAASVLLMGFGWSAMVLVTDESAERYYYIGLLLVLLFTYTLVRLPFGLAALSAWFVTLAYASVVFVFEGHTLVSVFHDLIFLAAANTLGMFAVHARERYARDTFFQDERLRTLIDAMNEGLVTVDSTGRVTWANRSVCELMGVSEAELVDHHAAEFLDEENRTLFAEQFADRNKGSTQRYEIEWTRKDGMTIPTLVSPQPLFDTEDGFAGSVAVISDIRALKAAQRALERSEARIRAIFESAAVGFAVIDANGRIIQVNPHLAELCGYTEAELLAGSYFDLIPAEDRAAAEERLVSFTTGQISQRRGERRYLRKDGSIFYGVFSLAPLLDQQGALEAIIISVVNITSLKQAEKALKRSERHFRELVDHASSIILRWDADGTIRFVNPYGLRFLGYKEEEICGRNVMGTIVPERESTGRNLTEVIAEIALHPERHLYNENEICDQRGRRYWVVWTNRGLTDASGRVSEVLSIGTDITELKNAREELARQRDALAELNGFIRRIFGRYVSDAVVHNLLESPAGLEVGGRTECVSILVADIRGFSVISEDLAPEQVVSLLNTYLEAMTEVIERYGGTIDEFVGDAILVIFGAPGKMPDHAESAVACALAMQLGIDQVNARNHALGLPAIEIGIGVHTGEVVVGNIGSQRRAKYGAVGTNVNLATRIETYTVGGQVLVSEATRRSVGPILQLGRRTEVEPKGVRAPLAVYEVRGMGGHHDLALPPQTRELDTVAFDLRCRYFVLEEKFVQRTAHHAQVIRLSATEAEVVCDTPPTMLANLKLLLIDDAGDTIGNEIYAKVVQLSDESPSRVTLRFTSISTATKRAIEEMTVSLTAEATV